MYIQYLDDYILYKPVTVPSITSECIDMLLRLTRESKDIFDKSMHTYLDILIQWFLLAVHSYYCVNIQIKHKKKEKKKRKIIFELETMIFINSITF